MNDAIAIVLIFTCLLAYGLLLDWSLRGQEKLIAAWREDDSPEDRER